MSTVRALRPTTSSGASSLSAKEGTIATVTRSALPSRQSADDPDQTARRLERESRLRLLHRQNAASSSTVDTQIEFEPDMGGVSSRLHDDEAHLSAWVLGRDQQIDVSKDAAARLVEHEIAQRGIGRR